MCHNHSHIIAGLLGEDTAQPLSVLTYQLANAQLRIESPHKDGGLLTLKTSGLLRVPSMMLAASYPWHQPAMGEGRTSVFFLPDGATTTILKATWDWMSALETSPDPSPAWVPHLIASAKIDDQGDVPW